MDPFEALLTKKVDELESQVLFLENPKELHFPHFRSRLSFLKSLIAAETGGTTFSGTLSHIAARISALESIFSNAEDPKTATFTIRLLLLRNNLQELESMAKEPFWYHQHQSAAKIRGKISFTKSLLDVEAQSEDLSSLRARIVAVEEAFGHLSAADDATQPSCSSTSCHTEEAGEEEALALSFKKKIQTNGGDYDDVQRRNIGFLRFLLAAEKKWKGEEEAEEEFHGFVKRFSSFRREFADRNKVLDDDAAIGINVSSSCSCTSSCFGGGEEKEKQAEVEEKSVSDVNVNETGELCSNEARERKSETADSENGSVGVGGGLEKRFGKLRAMGTMAGVFAVAAVGVVVGSFFSEKEMAYLVPT